MKNYKDDFLKYLKDTKKYTDNTIKTYDVAITSMFEYAKLEEKENYRFLLDLRIFRKSMQNQSSSTIAKKLSAIRSYIDFLELGGIYVDLLGDDNVHVTQEHFEAIPSKNIKKALTNATIEEKLIIYLIYNYGLRISEISNLKLEDIKEHKLYIKYGRNKREIPLEFTFLKHLGNFLAQFERNYYLFEKNEKKLSENSLRYMLAKCFKRVELKVTPQQLRYSLVVDMIVEGARVDDIKELLGHKSFSMVLPKVEFSNTKKIKAYKTIHPMCKDDNGIFN